MAGVAEPVGFIVVVIGGGKILAATLDGGIGDAVPVLDTGGAELDVVPGVGLFDAGVMGDAQSVLVCLVFHGFHYVAIDAQDLDAIHAHGFELANSRAAFLRVAWDGIAIEHRVNEDAGRDDLIFGALPAELQCFLCVAADVANRGDPARHPDFQFVIDRLRNSAALILNMGMRVDQTRHDVLAFGVDFDIAYWPPGSPSRERHGIERDDVQDAAVLDDNIFRTRCGRAVAFDNEGIADDEARVAAAADDAGLGQKAGGGAKDQENAHILIVNRKSDSLTVADTEPRALASGLIHGATRFPCLSGERESRLGGNTAINLRGHVFADHRTVLESVTRAAADQPNFTEVRVSIDQEIASGGVLVLANSGFYQGRICEPGKTLGEKNTGISKAGCHALA